MFVYGFERQKKKNPASNHCGIYRHMLNLSVQGQFPKRKTWVCPARQSVMKWQTLKEMGYLIQPHTSAGRIPSDEGYRFYVNSLMRKYKIGMEAVAQLQSILETRVSQLEKLIRYARCNSVKSYRIYNGCYSA